MDDSVQVKYISYFKNIDIYKLKKILSANQMIIDMFAKNGVEISGLSKNVILRDIYGIERKHVIRPECRFTYNGTDCFVETVRRNPSWQEKLADKLGYYHELFNLPEGRLSVKTENPVLILISEDENHCEEVIRIAAKAKHKGILVTSDKFTYTLTPDNAFFKPAIQSKENLFSKLKSLLKAS